MKLSVVIVNYNVKAYLEQCLNTVLKALEGIDGEVFVVDNQSTDGSVEMVRQRFPQVRLIANKDNVGFSRANNQAIRIAQGEYVLLLNPDTVVGEDVFHKVLRFLDEHPLCGGLGVKMIDGTGRFLPESKRGLPTPQVAFFKIVGLTRMFPKSRIFGRYHLGHLPENEAAPIEILSGACMFLRKETLEKVGLLDESFFMYGEDIDLSYRITLGGYQNWYFPDARIIHYKGESTKKSSVNYVFVFYNAMAIFAKKHFTRQSAGIFPLLINGSIYLSAAGAIAVRFLNRTLLPILDMLGVVGILALRPLVPDRWHIAPELGFDLVAAVALMAWTWLWGGYDRPVRSLHPVLTVPPLTGIVMAGMAIRGASFGAFQEIGLTMLFLLAWMLAIRGIMRMVGYPGHDRRRRERERILAVGSESEGTRAIALLWQTHFGLGWTSILPMELLRKDRAALLRTIRSNRVGEVVFCARDLSWQEIIAQMEQLRNERPELKIAQPQSSVVIGPSSIESLQDLELIEGGNLISPGTRRRKRALDIAVAALLLLLFPAVALITRAPALWGKRILNVLLGRHTWVGYRAFREQGKRLPFLPQGVFSTIEDGNGLVADALVIKRANTMYAKDYRPWHDLRIIGNALTHGS